MAEHAVRVQRIASLDLEVVEAASDRTFSKHIHDQYGIGLLLHGAQQSASGRGPVEATTGDLISVNPGEVHDGKPIGLQGRRWHMLYLSPQRVQAVLDDMAADRAQPAAELSYPVLRHTQAAALFQTLYQTVRQPGGRDHALVLDETLPMLLAQLLDRPLPPAPAADSAAGRARSRIDDTPLQAVTLAELAQEAGLSRFQLIRAFTRLTGLTPHAYLLQRRLLWVRQQIAAGMPLAEAAHASGFADQSHMTRCFVRSFGYTPGRYAQPAR